MHLRPYQSQSIESIYSALRSGEPSALAVLPTGAGKSAVVATLCRDAVEKWGGRVLVLCHVRELLSQLAETLRRVWPEAPLGIYSAGLGEREGSTAIVVAGIQSVFRRGTELGRFELVVVDECHLIPAEGDGMYRQLLTTLRVINPDLRIVGLTATPYRMDSGYVYGDESLFSSVCYEAKVRDLIGQGFLSPLRGKDGGAPDLSNVHIRGGEYIASELEDEMADEEKVEAACAEILRHGAGRDAWLVFCCGVKHAKMVAEELEKLGVVAPVITGDTPTELRDLAIEDFKSRSLRCLVNINVLTTGFDAPHVDLVVLLRPTQSPGLYYQMVGRGLRKAPGKNDCLVLDLGGNIARHGPVDAIRIRDKRSQEAPGEAPTKACPQCAEVLPAAAIQCNACGFEFPREVAKHQTTAAVASPLSEPPRWIEVQDWYHQVHAKKGAPETHPKTLRITYVYGWRQQVSEWLCIEHTGFARQKAEAWWEERTGQRLTAKTASEASILLHTLKPRAPRRVLIQEGGQYPELVQVELEPSEEGYVDADEPTYQAGSPQENAISGTYFPEDEPPF